MTGWARPGAVLVALYIVVAAATTSWAPGRLRPLFDGFGSHGGQYNWVNPPRELSEGNQRPEPAKAEVVLDATGSQPTSAGPNDGQALAALVPGALAAHPPDTKATLALTPVDAGRLGPLPAGLRPEGNAYLVAIAYAPSGKKAAALARPGTVSLTSAAPADTLLFSPDGKAWVAREGRPLGRSPGITGPLDAAGYYLAASKGAPRATAGGKRSGSGGRTVLVLAAVSVPGVLAWLLLSRRRPATAAKARGGPGRPRPGAGGQRSGKGGRRKGGKGPTPRRR